MSDILLKLSCFGLITDGFTNCSGIENTILKVDNSLYNYNEILDYLDVCRLFDKPMLEYNAIRHFIYNIHNRFDQVIKPIWSKKRVDMYHRFILDHNRCGLMIKLALPEEEVKIETQKDIPIKIEKINETEKFGKLRLIRNK